MMRGFSIWGEDRIELHNAPSLSEARQWAASYTCRDFGGWDYLTIRQCDTRAEIVETIDNPTA